MLLLVLGLAAVLGCATAKPPTEVADRLPTRRSLCDQIVDHIEAYIEYVACEQGDGQTGYFPAVAETKSRGDSCTAVNEVDRLPYDAPAVDQAVLTVMRHELQGESTVHLYDAVEAIWIASLDESDWATEDYRRRAQARLLTLVEQVPWLMGRLVDRVMDELGESEACLPRRERAVDVSGLPEILATMNQVMDDPPCPGTATGLFMVDGIDPNIAVAISRLQRGNRAAVPTERSVLSVLERMGVKLVHAPDGFVLGSVDSHPTE